MGRRDGWNGAIKLRVEKISDVADVVTNFNLELMIINDSFPVRWELQQLPDVSTELKATFLEILVEACLVELWLIITDDVAGINWDW